MIPEIGHFALILAMWVAVTQAVLPLWGAARNQPALMRYGHRAALVHAVLILAAFGLLAGAFWANDFSVGYVAAHSNSGLPVQYRLAAVWGGHEGSLLLWVTILATWGAAVAVFSRSLPLAMRARVLVIIAFVQMMIVETELPPSAFAEIMSTPALAPKAIESPPPLLCAFTKPKAKTARVDKITFFML